MKTKNATTVGWSEIIKHDIEWAAIGCLNFAPALHGKISGLWPYFVVFVYHIVLDDVLYLLVLLDIDSSRSRMVWFVFNWL